MRAALVWLAAAGCAPGVWNDAQVGPLEIRYAWTGSSPGGLAWLAKDVTGDGLVDAVWQDRTRLLSVVPGPLAEDKDLDAVAIPLFETAELGRPGDVDGDGIADLWVRRAGVYGPELLRGPIGAGSLPEAGPEVAVGELAEIAALGDLDGDALPDLVTRVTDLPTGQALRLVGWSAPFDDAALATPRFELLDCDTDPFDYGIWWPQVFGPIDVGTGPALSVLPGDGVAGCDDALLDGDARGTIDPHLGDPALTLGHAPILLWDLSGDGVPDFLEPQAPNGPETAWASPFTLDPWGELASFPLAIHVRSWAVDLVLRGGHTVDFEGDGVRSLIRPVQTVWGQPDNHLEVLAATAEDLEAPTPTVLTTWTPPSGGTVAVGDVVDLDADGREEVFLGTDDGIVVIGRP